MKTNGGWISHLEYTNFQDVSTHTVIVSTEFFEDVQGRASKAFEVEEFFKAVMKFMSQKGMGLKNTEGMIDAGIFPVNYFSVSQLSHFYENVPDEIAQILSE